MIVESLAIMTFALLIDFFVGDPKSRFHPTAWIGNLIGRLVPFAKSNSPNSEKVRGMLLVLLVTGSVAVLLVLFQSGIKLISVDIVGLIASIIISSILLKTTIALKGMQSHASNVIAFIEKNDIESARNSLSMIVKRNTTKLDKNHIISGVLESVSENTVDGITGPMFYFAFFGLPGAFVYRTINTIDSMIGYKTNIFKNIGWFGANCDKFLNYIPSRLTAFIMILSAMILRYDWKKSYQIIIRDSKKLDSPNAGYPMAALAGAIGTRLEKIDHYSIGDGSIELTKSHIQNAFALMKVTTILFCGLVVTPIIISLSYLGWWIHA